jgi:diadenosine tetraphosphate (Ap4A) HIT family hydrolase
VSIVAAAIKRELQPARINYECLGNQLHHIHWHVIPRYADDPQPTQPIWLRNPAERCGSLTPEQEKSLITGLSAAIAASRG